MNKAFLIVHMHEFYLQKALEADRLVGSLMGAITLCKDANMPLYIGNLVLNSETEELHPMLRREADKNPLAKYFYGRQGDIFMGTGLETTLRLGKIDDIIIGGVYANACAKSAAKSAKLRGFGISTSPALLSDTTEEEFRKAMEYYRANGRVEDNYFRLFR